MHRRVGGSSSSTSSSAVTTTTTTTTDKDEPLDPKSLPEGEPEIEIESLIIPAVKELHSEYVDTFERERRGRSGTPA